MYTMQQVRIIFFIYQNGFFETSMEGLDQVFLEEPPKYFLRKLLSFKTLTYHMDFVLFQTFDNYIRCAYCKRKAGSRGDYLLAKR